MEGRLAGIVAGALALVACGIIEPIPPFEYEDVDSSVDGSELDQDAGVKAEAGTEAAATDARDSGANEDVPEDDGGPDLSLENPCPNKYMTCCGYDEDGGPGPLYLYGEGRYIPGTCDKCLARHCDPATEFCCAPAGDNPPDCMPLSMGQLCGK
jgi:hypothetical protein